MLLAICVIMFAWLVEMPLWLSIVATVFGGITLFCKLINLGMDVNKRD